MKRTAFGESFPSIVSKLRWNPLSGDMEPPSAQGYKEWLCCVANWDCETKACEDKVDPSQIRWSPRRSHGATVLDKTLFVMGGRARSLDDISPEESIGSIVGERNRWREISILMSDVWTSPDGGECAGVVRWTPAAGALRSCTSWGAVAKRAVPHGALTASWCCPTQ